MTLSSEHIDFIIKDLHARGIVLEGFQDEVIDHVCSAVEKRMDEGEKFIDAYKAVIKSFGSTKGLQKTQKETSMFQNYVTIAIRQILKGRLYSAVNAFTLSIGIAASLLIGLYVYNELSYDKWNPNADRLFRVDLEIKFNDNHVVLASCPAPTGATLQQDFGEIESTVRLASLGAYLVRRSDAEENGREDNVIWTDSTFFKVFSVPVIMGNQKNALKEAGSVAISRKMMKKYFPDGDPLGKLIVLDNKYTAKITSVFEDIPQASHFHYDILIAMVGDWPMAKRALSTQFTNESFNTYVMLRKGADAAALQARLPGFIIKYVGPSLAEALGSDFSMTKFLDAGNKYDATLTPVTDIHLTSNKINELEPNGDVTYVYMLEVIAALTLAIACVNFMNLSTARSTRRAREVGVRKAMGSLKTHLVRLFLTESIAITSVSVILAVLLSWLLVPVFNELASKQLSIPFDNITFYLVLGIAVLVIGTLAGLYPAVVISSFKTSDVLKGRSPVLSNGLVRNGLVVFQFVISIILIVGTITINRQLNFIQSKKLGFDKSHVITVKNGYALRPNASSFKTEALKLSGIETGTMSGYVPVTNVDAYRSAFSFWKEGKSPVPENLINLQNWSVDEDYIPTFGMEVLTGRNFSQNKAADARSIILNEAAVKLFGFEDDPIGKRINTFGDAGGNFLNKDSVDTYTVIGVIRDFHFSSMKEAIAPLMLTNHEQDGSFSFRFKTSQTSEVIAGLEKIWKQISPGQPFQYSFLDDDFGKMYTAEQRLGSIFQVFAVLAIIIACLGLFALTAFSAEQRTKEIGIRKVLGASVPGIVLLLSREFGKLILIAFVVSAPMAWYVVSWWLTSYSYKTEIGVGVYVLAGAIIAVIAIFTMSFQSIKAALANPVKALRSE
ncbi:MAG TPA: ABC transporter permease [Cyclobacteriaceae bacterium]|nr:ABC transporter permease [Cyclobacteriaceae bacterium]